MPNFEIDEWREFTEDERKCYELWFEFLKLSKETDWSLIWSKKVLDYFGDIPNHLSFNEWWPDHKYLFDKLDPFIIHEVKTDFDFQMHKDQLPTEDDAGIVVIALNMYMTKQQLRDAFEKILTKYHKGKAGRPEFDRTGEVFSLYQRPDTEMLTKILNVYKEYLADPEEDRRALWRIEEKCSLIDKDAAVLWKIKDNEESRRKSQHSTVSRYIDYAEEILENVVKGKFPVYTVKKVKDEGTTPAT